MTQPQFGILVCWNQKGSRVCLTQLSTLWGRNLDSGPDRQTQRLYSELEGGRTCREKQSPGLQ